MEERHFILYQNEHTEHQGEQTEVIQTLRVEEIMADGNRKTVYSDIHLHNESVPPVIRSVFKRLIPKQTERRVWRSGRRAA